MWLGVARFCKEWLGFLGVAICFARFCYLLLGIAMIC
jgi:hypothetical protein